MTLSVDLHIHSCLSPCSDDDMTPYNIAAVASLNGLDAISVTDHNACGNSVACAAACADFGILYVPGVEVTTQEDVHALCYFPTLDAQADFCALLERNQPFVPNNPDYFGRQILMNVNDEPVGECQRWLLQAVALPLETLELEARTRGGVLVPAHIDREANSVLANLGFLPPSLQTRWVEVWRQPELDDRYSILRSSDAHHLQDILERGFPIPVKDSIVFEILRTLLES